LHGQQGTLARIAAMWPGALGATTASQLLADAGAGSREVLGVLDDIPVLVVELGAHDAVGIPIPVWLPAVVVAVVEDTAVAPAPVGVDVALCQAGANVPPGWVASDDPAAELARLVAQVRTSPLSSVMLAQLLRLSLALDADAAIMAESLAYSTLQGGAEFAAWLRGRDGSGRKVRAEPDEVVIVERHGDRLVVTLHRPHVRNAVNNRLRDALVEALTVAAVDQSITAVELRGDGAAFSSGGDLDEFGTLSDPVFAHLTRVGRSPSRLLSALGTRVTARVHGSCVGAGIELAAFAGTVIALPGTRFQLPEVALGLIPGSGGTVSIPRRIGRHRAAWMGLTATEVQVDTALAWGLVDTVVADH
jgi:enoyl-CoA hydratase/carnithine racemase